MNIDHVHFYVEDAQYWQNWFTHKWGFQLLSSATTSNALTVKVGNSAIQFQISAPQTDDSSVAAYLRRHPAGIADLAFQVTNLEQVMQQAARQGAEVLLPIQQVQTETGWQKLAQIRGWGDLQHTLIEQHHAASFAADAEWAGIDHVVLNVEQGDLSPATTWYEAIFGLQRCQNFAIQTEYSALCSQVLSHPQGLVQFPINEPASAESQIQEFLNWNRGAGIQHIALRTHQIVPLMARLRQQGIPFLAVPADYYEQLQQRSGFPLSLTESQAIAQQQVLADWQSDNPQALLLQAFTHPIFEQPTFFFELIERRSYRLNHQLQTAEGFGEGNFRALFQAIEREQIKRGSLKPH